MKFDNLNSIDDLKERIKHRGNEEDRKLEEAATKVSEEMEKANMKNDEGFAQCVAERLEKHLFKCVERKPDTILFKMVDSPQSEYATLFLDYGYTRSVEFTSFGKRTEGLANSDEPGMILNPHGSIALDALYDFREGSVYAFEASDVDGKCKMGNCECAKAEPPDSEEPDEIKFFCSECGDGSENAIKDSTGKEYCSVECLNERVT